MPTTKPRESDPLDGILHLTSDEELSNEIKSAGSERLVIVYFSLPWCGSCQKMNPAVEALSNKYGEEVTFLQVNADKCPGATKKHHVTKVPVFLLFNNRIRVDRVEGASPSELETKIRRNLADLHFQAQGLIPHTQPLTAVVSHAVKMSDVTPYMDKSQCRCVNDLTPTPFNAFIEGKKLISGKGVGRMILVYAFKEKMVINGLKIKAPVYSAPKLLRFFVNLHKVLDFSVVSQMSSSLEVSIGETDLSGDHTIELKSGGLVGVLNLQIYVAENMTKDRRTEIDSLILIGAPMALTGYAGISKTEYSTSIGLDTASIPEEDDDSPQDRRNIISKFTQATPSSVGQQRYDAGPGPSNKRADLYNHSRKR